MGHDVDGSGITDHAYAETLGLLLLWELRHAADPKHSHLNPVRGGLTARQLTRVREFIDAQIPNEITISDLAAMAELSHYHFIRAFKDTVGLSPYQYVLSERQVRLRFHISARQIRAANPLHRKKCYLAQFFGSPNLHCPWFFAPLPKRNGDRTDH